MAKILRKAYKIFGSGASASAGGLEQFGGLAAGAVNFSTDPETLQSLNAWVEGWNSATLGVHSPVMEERNAVDYVHGYQIGYLLQQGVPEWLSTQTYYENNYVVDSNGKLRVSVIDENIGNDPASDQGGQYWGFGGGSGSGKSVGEVFWSQSSSASDNPGALPLFTGETISSADAVYPGFYAWVLAHTELQISAADYETALSTYGECPKYVIDDTNKTIRLPKLTNYIKMANTTDGITQSVAGLPNITGETTAPNIGNYVSGGTGAFIQKQFSSTNTGVSAGSGLFGNILDFDASRSSDVYGKSDTNTPAHTTLFPWVCAYNAVVPASTAQAAEFQAALTSKADVDFSNITTAAKKVVFDRAFTPANITIAKGNAAIAGTYTLTDLPDDGVVRLVLLNCRLVLGANNRSSMAIQTDVMNNYITVAETNNAFTASGAVLVPMIRQVTLSFPQIAGGVTSDTEFMFRGYI